MRTFVIALTLCALGGPGVAQQASFTYLEKGCLGTGKRCPGVNENGGSFRWHIVDRPVAIQIDDQPLLVTGFEMFMRSVGGKPVELGVALFGGTVDGGPKWPPLRWTSILVTEKLQWYRAMFNAQQPLRDETAFLAIQLNAAVVSPTVAYGETARTWEYFVPLEKWTSALPQPWAIRAIGCRSTPHIGHTGYPGIGKSFEAKLDRAPPRTPVVLLTGGSWTWWGPVRLPLPLTAIGAWGCYLRTTPDVMLFAMTDAQGDASSKLVVPNDSRLIHTVVGQQWAVFDPGANPLGLTFTRLALVRVGP